MEICNNLEQVIDKMYKVIQSCETKEQLQFATQWACRVLDTVYVKDSVSNDMAKRMLLVYSECHEHILSINNMLYNKLGDSANDKKPK